MLVVCERWVGDVDRLLHIDPKVLLTIAALLSLSSWAAQPWVTESPIPLSGAGFHSAGTLSPTGTGTDSSRRWHLVILLSHVHLLPVGVRICHHHRIQPRPQVKLIFRYLQPDAPVSLFFRSFTQVHLLIDGSVEGQYVTSSYRAINTDLLDPLPPPLSIFHRFR